MYIKQSKNTFIRTTDRYGYVINQLTRQDRSYNASGADWLKEINRIPQDIDEIVNRLCSLYEDADFDVIKNDFRQFVESLAQAKFVVIGETVEELDAKDEDFTYNVELPKTLADNFYQETKEKVIENTQDFFLDEVQDKPLISSLQFELSSRCNERCIHCYIPNEKKSKGFDMPLRKVKSILDEFAQMGGIHVTLSGGEAFLHKDIIEIAEYCREKDLKISILSNLISLKDEQIPRLKAVNLSLIQVSLYSMDPEIHDFITTVKGSFDKTIASIEKLVAADIPIQISCPIMKANRKGYDKVLEYVLYSWNFPGKNTRVGCHFLLQGIFPTQGSNLCLLCVLRYQVDSLTLCHLGSLYSHKELLILVHFLKTANGFNLLKFFR